MPDLIVVKKPLVYGGKQYAVGARFAATEVDARYFVKRLRAEEAPPARPVRAVASVKAPETKPEPTPEAAEAPAADEEAAKPQPYRTRRLKAED